MIDTHASRVEVTSVEQDFPADSVVPRTSVKLPIKPLLVGVLLVILAIGTGYKWYEWQTLKAFASMHNQSIEKELELIHEVNKLAREMDGSQEEEAEDTEPTEEEIEKFIESGGAELQKDFEDGQTDFEFFNEKSNEYGDLLRTHRDQYNDFANNRLKFVYGPTADHTREIAAAMTKYYDNELSDLEHNRVTAQLYFALSEARKDMFLLQIYAYNTRGFLDEQATSESFNSIASLEKYGRDDFKFEKEDKIKEFHPYGYESLQKFRTYFKTTYSAIKDVVAGNIESAGYKFSRLGQETADLGTIDDKRLSEEGEAQMVERKRALVEALLTRYEVVQKLASASKSNLPVVGGHKDWNQELLACHAYVYKADLYRAVRDKYPEAKDVKAFVEEMNQVSPKTTVVDDSDQYQYFSVENGDKDIKVTCKNADGTREYQLTYVKDVEEDEKAAKKKKNNPER